MSLKPSLKTLSSNTHVRSILSRHMVGHFVKKTVNWRLCCKSVVVTIQLSATRTLQGPKTEPSLSYTRLCTNEETYNRCDSPRRLQGIDRQKSLRSYA